MPAIGLYFPGTQEEVNALRERLNALAGEFGYTATRGPTTGQGNLAEMLVAIDAGELALVLLPDEQFSPALEVLDGLAAEDPYRNDWAATVARSLRDTLDRSAEADLAEIEEENQPTDVGEQT